MPAIPDPDERPDAWQDPATLEYLFVECGWDKQYIADRFGVTRDQVVHQLRKHGIKRYEAEPRSGTIARKIHFMDPEDLEGDTPA